MQRFRSFPLFLWLFLLFLSAQAAHGADATSFDPTKVAVTAQGSGGVPVGTIIAWPVATNPEDMSNWLECNGQSISRSVFPELFAVMGAKVPDLRGYFLRGYGGKSGTLGVQQDAEKPRHTHPVGKVVNGTGYHGGGYGAFLDYSHSGDFRKYGVKYSGAAEYEQATENRPINKAVRYLIRARP
ncbi:phage tail protein [Desulfovibrio sp. ZJ369]|uniref:phage tail protein n=1 Tax=Desulfovibrio sp. ZJ369 TaxID=2709793 RepID=UPI0013EACAC7|nr:phage tail protein [Desulfovibrio sp. ZJ369]